MTGETGPLPDLATRWLGRPLVRLETVDSTNKEAWRRAEAGAPHGLVVVAAAQTAGMGRRQRTWISPAGEGVYASAFLRPGPLAAGAGLLGIAAGVAAAEATEDIGVETARIKWPNDVWVGDRKIAGILTEARDATRPDGLYVVGIGVNVNQTVFPDELRAPATSIRLECGVKVEPDVVLARLLGRLEIWIDTLIAGRLAALDAAFSARDLLTSRCISFTLSGEEIVGEVRRISPLHGLRLRLAGGEERLFPPDHVNEVRLMGVQEDAP